MTIKIFILLYFFNCVMHDLNSHSLLNAIFKSVYMFLYEIDKHKSLMTHLQTKFPVALHERGGWVGVGVEVCLIVVQCRTTLTLIDLSL